jgi:hypothetical protein
VTDLLSKIRSRGHWRVVIRPTAFKKDRVGEISSLFPIVERSSVSLRGWDFPHIDRRKRPHVDLDWVGQELAWEHHIELWRLYESGQFVQVSGMWDDWRDQSGLWPPDDTWKTGSRLEVLDATFRFIEIFEFAARLCQTEAGSDRVRIVVTVSGLNGRTLYLESPNRVPLLEEYSASIKEVPYEVELSKAELIAAPREHALAPTARLLGRFGWDAGRDMLKGLQAELGRR